MESVNQKDLESLGIVQIKLQPAPAKHKDKKWMVTIQPYGEHKSKFKVLFGRVGYTDQLIQKDEERRQRYLERHNNEKQFWDLALRANTRTASFWSRWLLWNEDLESSIKQIEETTGVKINYSKASVKKHIKALASQVLK